jgi:hypothetical protein
VNKSTVIEAVWNTFTKPRSSSKLRACRERPPNGSAADDRDELSSSHELCPQVKVENQHIVECKLVRHSKNERPRGRLAMMSTTLNVLLRSPD